MNENRTVFDLEDNEAVVAMADLLELCLDLFENEKVRKEMAKDTKSGISALIKSKPAVVAKICKIYLCKGEDETIKVADIFKSFIGLMNNEDFKELLGIK